MPGRKKDGALPEEEVNDVLDNETPEVEEVVEEVVDTAVTEEDAAKQKTPPTPVKEEAPAPKKPATAKKVAEAAEVVEASAKKGKWVKVSFIQAHTFNIGTQRIEAKKGDRMDLELHLANLFAERRIAFIIS